MPPAYKVAIGLVAESNSHHVRIPCMGNLHHIKRGIISPYQYHKLQTIVSLLVTTSLFVLTLPNVVMPQEPPKGNLFGSVHHSTSLNKALIFKDRRSITTGGAKNHPWEHENLWTLHDDSRKSCAHSGAACIKTIVIRLSNSRLFVWGSWKCALQHDTSLCELVSKCLYHGESSHDSGEGHPRYTYKSTTFTCPPPSVKIGRLLNSLDGGIMTLVFPSLTVSPLYI